MSFSKFNLNKDFIRAIETAGYQTPTALQSRLIPLIKDKKSAIIRSQSASGKTGAFLIPSMNYILENPAPEKRGARVLILTSRRDRVSQINHTMKSLTQDIAMRFGFIVSGRPYQTQMRLMRRPLDIMIATPGRLNDLMENGKADFSQLEILILDDLASILKKNLQGLIENIMKQADENCSSITFITEEDEKITTYSRSLFPNAEYINIDNDDDVSETTSHKTTQKPKTQAQQKNNVKKRSKIDAEKLMPQKLHIADDYTHKIAMMDHLMDELSGEPTIIYTTTNKAAKTLQENLSNHGHIAELIEVIEKNEQPQCDIIIYSDQSKIKVDTDLMSTLDRNIINFDLPNTVDAYISRLNNHHNERKTPTLLILDGHNFNELKSLEKTIEKQIDQATIPGLEPLNPFVNLSKNKPKNRNNNNPNTHKRKNTNNQNNTQQTKNKKTKNSNRRKNNNPNTQGKSSQSGDSAQKRQHKGAFGRLNGGTHRKNNKSVGVSRVGTDAPKGEQGWKSDFAQPKERSTSSGKKVKISYNKKRTLLIEKPEEI